MSALQRLRRPHESHHSGGWDPWLWRAAAALHAALMVITLIEASGGGL